jgi:hypothetical protein
MYIRGYPNEAIFNFLQTVVATWEARELAKRKRH